MDDRLLMKRGKILFINGAQFGHSSGHYYYCKYLSKSFDILYVCYDRGLEHLTVEGVEVKYVPFKGSKVGRMLGLLKESILQSRKFSPDILFVTYFNLSFLTAIFCKSHRTVLDIRTGSLKENKLSNKIDNLVLYLQSVFFSKIIILSESLRQRLSLPSAKCKIVPLGSVILYEGSHKLDDLNLIYIGTLDGRNISDTILGLNQFIRENDKKQHKISYTIIGFGSEAEEEKIIRTIFESNLDGIVKYEGRKNYNELAPYFEISSVGVAYVPQTSWYDCQPLTKLYEYMLSGMPVIATNTFENRIMINTDNGVLINDTPDEFCLGLTHIYNNRFSYNSDVIRKSVELYTWENIVNNNLRPFLEGLLSSSVN
jgi:glycosyltransferase involved in cell wall biosynthesis